MGRRETKIELTNIFCLLDISCPDDRFHLKKRFIAQTKFNGLRQSLKIPFPYQAVISIIDYKQIKKT